MDNEAAEGILTSSMGSVLSGPNKDEKNDACDSTPTSSTDAHTTATTSHILTDDPISSTSSDVLEANKPKEDMSANELDAKQFNMPDLSSIKSSVGSVAENRSLLVSDADLLCMNITDVSSEKITEDVEDIVQDLENLLGESSTILTKSSPSRSFLGARDNIKVDDVPVIDSFMTEDEPSKTPDENTVENPQKTVNAEEPGEVITNIETADKSFYDDTPSAVDTDDTPMAVDSVNQPEPGVSTLLDECKIPDADGDVSAKETTGKEAGPVAEITGPPEDTESSPMEVTEAPVLDNEQRREAVEESSAMDVSQDNLDNSVEEVDASSKIDTSVEPDVRIVEPLVEQEDDNKMADSADNTGSEVTDIVDSELKVMPENVSAIGTVNECSVEDDELLKSGIEPRAIKRVAYVCGPDGDINSESPCVEADVDNVVPKDGPPEMAVSTVEAMNCDENEGAIVESSEQNEAQIKTSTPIVEPLEIVDTTGEHVAPVEVPETIQDSEVSEAIESIIESASSSLVRTSEDLTATSEEKSESVEDRTLTATMSSEDFSVSDVDNDEPSFEDILAEQPTEQIDNLSTLLDIPTIDETKKGSEDVAEEAGGQVEVEVLPPVGEAEAMDTEVSSQDYSESSKEDIVPQSVEEQPEETPESQDTPVEKPALVDNTEVRTTREVEEILDELKSKSNEEEEKLVTVEETSHKTPQDVAPNEASSLAENEAAVSAIVEEVATISASEEAANTIDSSEAIEGANILIEDSASVEDVPTVVTEDTPKNVEEMHVEGSETNDENDVSEVVQVNDDVPEAAQVKDDVPEVVELNDDEPQTAEVNDDEQSSKDSEPAENSTSEAVVIELESSDDNEKTEDDRIEIITEENSDESRKAESVSDVEGSGEVKETNARNKPDVDKELVIKIDTVEEIEKSKSSSPKITIKPIKSPVEAEVQEKEESKGSLKMTITKQSDTMHSILKVYNPDEDGGNILKDEADTNEDNQEQSVPKLIIKSMPEHAEAQLSPKMSTRSSKNSNSTSRSGSPRITIKPIVKTDSKSELVSPLKITISKSKTEEAHRQKHSPKSLRSSKTEGDSGKEHHSSPRKSGKNKQSENQEQQVHSPRVTIKPIVKPPEELEVTSSPKITIKPIPKPAEAPAEQVSSPTTPRVTIKPIVKPDEEDVDSSEPVEKSSPKITIKPVVKPPESESALTDFEDAIKERIVLKINKSGKKRELSEEDRSEKLAKIKLKFSKEGGHPHIVPQEEEGESQKRPFEVDFEPEKSKRQKLDKISSASETHSKLKDILGGKCTKTEFISEETICSDDVKIGESKIISSGGQDMSSPKEDISDPISQIPVFEITPEGAKTLMQQSNIAQETGVSCPVAPPAPRKRGRPRKVPLVVREEFKDEPPILQVQESTGQEAATPESSRPKRSCRGPSVRTTLGIKPRKPRGAGRPRGSRRSSRSITMKPGKS